jgi:hypothetical protein
MTVEELSAEEKEYMPEDVDMTDFEAVDECGRVATFFAFCRVVVSRGLVVPLEKRHWKLLPDQVHAISRDYFDLGTG